MLASFTYDVSTRDATLKDPNTVEPDGWATAVVLVNVLPRYGTDVALVHPVNKHTISLSLSANLITSQPIK